MQVSVMTSYPFDSAFTVNISAPPVVPVQVTFLLPPNLNGPVVLSAEGGLCTSTRRRALVCSVAGGVEAHDKFTFDMGGVRVEYGDSTTGVSISLGPLNFALRLQETVTVVKEYCREIQDCWARDEDIVTHR